MATTGSPGNKARRAYGSGTIDKDGYHLFYPTLQNGKRKRQLAHRLVWEEANGPIPEGYEIHHINGDKLDNRLENLACMTRQEHVSAHIDPYLKKDEKQCPRCKNVFPRKHFKKKGGRASYCDKCWRDYSREQQRKHRERKFNAR